MRWLPDIVMLVAVWFLLAAGLVSVSEAQSRVEWRMSGLFPDPGPATMELAPDPTDPSVWVLTFVNRERHHGSEDMEMDLDGDVLPVRVIKDVDRSEAERIIVRPPPGWQADRLSITVPEYGTDRIVLWRDYGPMM